MSTDTERKKVSLPALYRMKADGRPIVMLTCYDYPTAHFQDQAGVDMILVGDSLGMTMLGYETTLPVTMDDMIRHAQAVRRGAPHVWLVGDMPYMSYQPSTEAAIRNAGRFMAEAGCDAVKLEGGREMADRVAAIVASGIPVMGHLGLTPQSAGALGGFRLQGKDAHKAKRIIDDVAILIDAGAFAVLLELVPEQVCRIAAERSKEAIIIGLGSGPAADGQLLIYHDMFGLYPHFRPRMAKMYADAGKIILDGIRQYRAEVTDGEFPQPENWFGMKADEYDDLVRLLGGDPT
ncbi:MAG: 3-methyl-2-oxobutanoate hydroxymethyltransferase [Chloroflexi bacterium]|nr:3-methyl-2-oxobutanoate hydroxymethyltransferase [Chloroflexota bacterium]